MTNGEALGPRREPLTVAERHMHLRHVTLAWLNGEVAVEIYREAREKYGTDIRAAIQAIARSRSAD